MIWQEVVFGIFLGAASLQLLYFLFFFGRLWLFKPAKSNKEPVSGPVSVIICARNESANLLEHLPHFFDQDYPDYEVVVVDDRSVDDTPQVLRAFAVRQPRLKIVTIPDTETFYAGKKFGLTLGIKAASHDRLLFSDADCKPASRNWISEMVCGFQPGTDIVLGFGGYVKKSGLLNALIRYDTFNVAMNYFSFALGGVPYMGVGRNLAYRKELFFKHKGFARHQHIQSGDDDLFVNQAGNSKNVRIVMSPESHTHSEPETTWSDWIRQKRRHLTTGFHYATRDKLLLGGLEFTRFMFFVTLIVLLSVQYAPIVVGSVFLARLIVQQSTNFVVMKRLETRDLWPFSVFFELVFLIFYPILGCINLAIKQNKWKR